MVHFKCFILTEDSPVSAGDAVVATCALFMGVVDADIVGDNDVDVDWLLAKLFGKSDLSFMRSAFRGPILSTASFKSSSVRVDSVMPSTRLSMKG